VCITDIPGIDDDQGRVLTATFADPHLKVGAVYQPFQNDTIPARLTIQYPHVCKYPQHHQRTLLFHPLHPTGFIRHRHDAEPESRADSIRHRHDAEQAVKGGQGATRYRTSFIHAMDYLTTNPKPSSRNALTVP
jgi:hypothetical protein